MTNDGSIPAGVVIVVLLFYAALLGLVIWVQTRIIQKAGYPGWWVLMMFVPIANIVMLCLFAFKEWPIRRELQYLRGYAAATGLPGYAQHLPYDPGYGALPGSPGGGHDVPPSQSWGQAGPWNPTGDDLPDDPGSR